MPQIQNELGRLEQVDLRTVWTREAEEFTPWLAQEENLRLLGDTIGMELELEAQEKNVGAFRADVLCKDTATDEWVLIENQLEKTDHIHLGQILTYAAGLNAVSIVWIARKFTEEHRAALDWLNEITEEHVQFFGLEIELWHIGDSQIAPKFNIISCPNDWSKTVASGASQIRTTALTESKLLQQEFWTVFSQYVKDHHSTIKTTRPLPQNWMNIAIGRSGVKLCAVASFWDSVAENYENHELRAELVLDDQHAKTYYKQLMTAREEIEQEINESLTWYNPPEKQMCRIYLRTSANLNDKEKWTTYHQWLLGKLETFYQVFTKRVKALKINES